MTLATKFIWAKMSCFGPYIRYGLAASAFICSVAWMNRYIYDYHIQPVIFPITHAHHDGSLGPVFHFLAGLIYQVPPAMLLLAICFHIVYSECKVFLGRTWIPAVPMVLCALILFLLFLLVSIGLGSITVAWYADAWIEAGLTPSLQDRSAAGRIHHATVIVLDRFYVALAYFVGCVALLSSFVTFCKRIMGISIRKGELPPSDA